MYLTCYNSTNNDKLNNNLHYIKGEYDMNIEQLIHQREEYVFEINFQTKSRQENFINSYSHIIWILNNTVHYKKRNTSKSYPLSFSKINSIRYLRKENIPKLLEQIPSPVIEYYDKGSIYTTTRYHNRHFNTYKVNENSIMIWDSLKRFSETKPQYISVHSIIQIRTQIENEQILSLINECSTKELYNSNADEVLTNINLGIINSINNTYQKNLASNIFLNEDIDRILSLSNNKRNNVPFITTSHINFNQLQSITHSINNDFTIIQGPPGTGKTTSIINIIASLYVTDKTMLFTSNNSDALRNLERKFIELNMPPFYLRIGKAEDTIEGIDDFIKSYESYNYTLKQNDDYFKSTLEIMSRELKYTEEVYNKLLSISKLSKIIEEKDFDNLHNNIKILLIDTTISIDYKNSAKDTSKLLDSLNQLISEVNKYKSVHNVVFFKKYRINNHYKKLISAYFNVSFKDFNDKYKSLEDKVEFNNYIITKINKVQVELEVYLSHLDYIEKIANYFDLDPKSTNFNEELSNSLNFTTIKDSYLHTLSKFKEFSSEYVHYKYKKKDLTSFYNKIKPLRDKISINKKQEVDEFNSYIYENYVNNKLLNNVFNLILVTNHSQQKLYKNLHFDYAIVDEASQTRISNGLLTFQLANSIVLVGDTMQFQPIIDNSMNDIFKEVNSKYNLPKIYNEKKYSLLEIMEKKSPVQSIFLLEEHYRCDDYIINFCNKEFYNNRLILNPHVNGAKRNRKSIELIRVNAQESTIEQHLNRNEANKILDICKSMEDKNSIGVITPYVAQTRLIQHTLNNIIPDKHIGTINSFQGQEFDTIILSLIGVIKDNNQYNLQYMLSSSKMFNIAVSRAIKKIYIIGDVDNIYQYLFNNKYTDSKLYKLLDYAIELESDNDKNNMLSNIESCIDNNIYPNKKDNTYTNSYTYTLSNNKAQEIHKHTINSKYEITYNVTGKEFIDTKNLNSDLFSKSFDAVVYKKIHRRLHAVLAISDDLIIRNKLHRLNHKDKEFITSKNLNMLPNLDNISLKLKPRQTHSEISFLNILIHKINKSEYRKSIIIDKNVELRNVIDLDKTLEYNMKYHDYATLAHFDYILYHKTGDLYYPYLVIELDGNEHRNNKKSIINDMKKDKICSLAGVNILRIPLDIN